MTYYDQLQNKLLFIGNLPDIFLPITLSKTCYFFIRNHCNILIFMAKANDNMLCFVSNFIKILISFKNTFKFI